MSDHLWIGMESLDDGGHKACGSEETRDQIDHLHDHSLDIRTPDGDDIEWEQLHLDDVPEDSDMPILNYLVEDRRRRIDEETLMADRPPFAIATIDDERVTRLEYYAGHDALSLEYDFKRDPDESLPPTYGGR